MTTVRRGASIGSTVTSGSRFEVEGERLGRVSTVGARRTLAPELEEVVLGHPVPVAQVEVVRAL